MWSEGLGKALPGAEGAVIAMICSLSSLGSRNSQTRQVYVDSRLKSRLSAGLRRPIGGGLLRLRVAEKLDGRWPDQGKAQSPVNAR
jgi:hypothetical protein